MGGVKIMNYEDMFEEISSYDWVWIPAEETDDGVPMLSAYAECPYDEFNIHAMGAMKREPCAGHRLIGGGHCKFCHRTFTILLE